MKKSTKGALAAGAAGVLLLGGAGSLAYWTDTSTVTGDTITAGRLALSDPSCGEWMLGDASPLADDDKIIPGDELTRVCTFTVDATNARMRAAFDVSAPGFDTDDSAAAILDELAVNATYEVTHAGATSSVTTPAVVENNDVITATIKVTFDYDADNVQNSQDLSATLNEITVTAKQLAPAA
jgi:alternate signal-mediated exported protein